MPPEPTPKQADAPAATASLARDAFDAARATAEQFVKNVTGCPDANYVSVEAGQLRRVALLALQATPPA